MVFRIRIRIGKFPRYLKKNPGALFILTFILTLVVDAFIYPSNPGFANDLTSDAFILLVIGVILQAISLARDLQKYILLTVLGLTVLATITLAGVYAQAGETGSLTILGFLIVLGVAAFVLVALRFKWIEVSFERKAVARTERLHSFQTRGAAIADSEGNFKIPRELELFLRGVR